MPNDSHMNQYEIEFVNKGFIILKKAISPKVIALVQQAVVSSLREQEIISINMEFDCDCLYDYFCSLVSTGLTRQSPFELLRPVYEKLSSSKSISKVLLEPAVFEVLSFILGRDLCHEDNPSLTLNVAGQTSRQNYLFKEFHQEIWSGADINTLQFWTPIFQTGPRGGIELIPGSHLWGHIPHRNRAPLQIPPVDVQKAELSIGDVIVFHSLLLHRSSSLPDGDSYRLALPCLIRNFRLQNDSFELYRNWRIFSYSPQSSINRKLGNHYLSPFRLLDVPMLRQDAFLNVE